MFVPVGIDANGNVTAAWTIWTGSHNVVQAARLLAGTNMPNVARYVFRDATGSGPNGGRTAPVNVSETIPSSSGYVSNPQVALDGNGLATVIYMGYGVEATRQVSSSSWTSPRPVITAPNAVST